jgi:hypothetical protein
VIRRLAAVAAALLAGAACGPSSGVARAPAAAAAATGTPEDRARTADFARVEDEAIDWLVAADPRIAARTGTTAREDVLEKIGFEAMLAEDTTAQIRGASLDLFAFRARARAIDEAGKVVAAYRGSPPETGPVGSALARPRLERELLGRLVEEERERTADEAKLGDAAGDLVRGIIATWAPPGTPQEVPDRDVWVSKHLLEVRDSLRDPRPRTGPPDLDMALYPLERLLAPLQFPRGSAAIAQVRMAIDEDMRSVPKVDSPERVARAARVHLGVAVDPAALPARLERLEARLRELAERVLQEAGPDARPSLEGRARELLLVERPCPPVPDSRVRSMAPPPERAAICGALRALTEETAPAAVLVALHDDVLLSLVAVGSPPPPRTRLLSHPPDDDVAALERASRERPVVALGAALAAELLYAGEGSEGRIAAWRALGEAPLDVVARELAR